jgi:hypothetical protein
MFEQLDDLASKPEIKRGTVFTFLLMIFLLGVMVGAQMTDFFLRRNWSVVGIGETFLVCVLLWKLSIPMRKAFKLAMVARGNHAR